MSHNRPAHRVTRDPGSGRRNCFIANAGLALAQNKKPADDYFKLLLAFLLK
jgi:hypothetical protein